MRVKNKWGQKKVGGKKNGGKKKVGVKKNWGRLRRIKIPSILKFLPKHRYYRPLKNRPNHQYYRPQKIEEIAEKKVVRNFLQKIKIIFFFEFFSENVFKTLLRGREILKVRSVTFLLAKIRFIFGLLLLFHKD